LQKLTSALKLQRHIIFHGFIGNREKVSETIRQFAIALAPYKFIKGSARLYGDATKIRAYMAAGLPTVTTNVPPLGKEVAEKRAAIIVDDNPRDVANAVMKIFSDKKLFTDMRKQAIIFAKKNTWDNEFRNAFEKMKDIKS
jgi:glycosyltransferase involved in cell wall biosynthesis